MKQVASRVILIAISLFLIRCTTTRENENPTPIVPDVMSTQAGKASLKVVNSSSYAVYYLHVALSSDSTWGPDKLDSSVISSGNSFTVNNIPAGKYDFRVQTIGYTQVASLEGIPLSGGQTYVWTVTNSSFPTPAHLKVVNNSSFTIYYIKAKPSGTLTWGPDVLGRNDTIDIGYSFTRFFTPGTYDLMAMSSTNTGQKSAMTLSCELTANMITTWTINTLGKLAAESVIPEHTPLQLVEQDGTLAGAEGTITVSSKSSGAFQKPGKQAITEPEGIVYKK